MVFDNTDLIIGGVISLGALAFAVTALVRARKNKKEREEAKKKYEAEQAAMPPLTPEQIKEIQDNLNGGSLTGRQTATRDIGNYGPNSRRANIAPAKSVPKSVPKSSDSWAQTRMAQDAAMRKRREEDDIEEQRRRNLDTAPMDIGLMPSSPLYQSRHDSGSSRCDDTPSHSHRSSHSSCSSSSWGGDSGSSSSSSYDSGSSCSSSSSCD